MKIRLVGAELLENLMKICPVGAELLENLMKIRPVGVELFHEEGRMDRHDDANSRFLQFCERA